MGSWPPLQPHVWPTTFWPSHFSATSSWIHMSYSPPISKPLVHQLLSPQFMSHTQSRNPATILRLSPPLSPTPAYPWDVRSGLGFKYLFHTLLQVWFLKAKIRLASNHVASKWPHLNGCAKCCFSPFCWSLTTPFDVTRPKQSTFQAQSHSRLRLTSSWGTGRMASE